MNKLTTIELCAGAGGQSLGLERAGFEHLCLIDNQEHCCNTLKLNRPQWNVIEDDLKNFDGTPFKGVDLLAGGLPCPPFSVAGKQLGKKDERNLFPEAIRLIKEINPRTVMIENVKGLLTAAFKDYREFIVRQLRPLGYVTDWRLLNASDFGVSQLRPRVVFVAIKEDLWDDFFWPESHEIKPPTVGEKIFDLIKAGGWKGANVWKKRANKIAPTVVGGSLKHGGPDLGPTRSKKAWAELGVDGHGIANEPPEPDFVGMPRLTARMVARLQGFPDEWAFSGKKTSAYRQIGNAFPSPVAQAVGEQIKKTLVGRKLKRASL